MDYRIFAYKIKKKYPVYGDMDDRELATLMVEKFPNDYKDVTFDEKSTITKMQPDIQGIAKSALQTAIAPITPPAYKPEGQFGAIPQQAGAGMVQGATMGYAMPTVQGISDIQSMLQGQASQPVIEEPKGVGQKAARIGGEIGGAVITSALTAGTSETPALAALLTKWGAGAVKGGVLGYAYNPSSKEVVGTGTQRNVQAVGGAALGAGIPALVSAYKTLVKPLTLTGKQRLYEQVGKDLTDAYRAKVESYGAALDEQLTKYPNKRVDLTGLIGDLSEEMEYETIDPSIKRIVNSSKSLKQLVNIYQTSIENEGSPKILLTARKTQELLNEFKMAPRLNQVGGARPEDLPKIRLHSQIKGELVNTFDEMVGVRQDYGEFKNAWKEINRMYRSQNQIDTIVKNWNNLEVRKTLDKVFTPEGVSDIGGYRNAGMALKALKWLGIGAAGTAATGAAISGAGYVANKLGTK